MLATLPKVSTPALLVGYETSDDACVYELPSGERLAQTTDFFTPVVDDAFQFGRIAAANALSDIYAMGGEPLWALSLIAWPVDKLPLEVLGEVMRGSADATREAGIPVAGGHSIDGAEPLCGLCVTGRIPPGKFWRNIGAQAGDALILCKPLGTGIASGLMKNGNCPPALAAAAIASMSALNADAAKAGRTLGDAIHACTDVTGFGLAGHASEMCGAADGKSIAVSLEISLAALPLLGGLKDYFAALPLMKRLTGSFHTGGAGRNLKAFEAVLDYGTIPVPQREITLDPQTSGGLLFAVAPDAAPALQKALHDHGALAAAKIGEFIPAKTKRIYFRE